MKRLPIGISDFEELVQNDYYFVDTTPMIGDIYRDGSKILLLTRPRRFGKTLNMSMLSYFFDNRKKTAELFKGLAVSDDAQVMGALNGYPTIFITFKDIKDRRWDTAEMKLKNLISQLYNDFYDSVKSVLKPGIEVKIYEDIINRVAFISDYQEGLKKLTEYLHRAYQKPVILIIDEYDVPIQSGWSNGYYEDVIDFMRGLLSGALKDNSFLFKGLLTGIYRVAKESIFSGLNNLKVYTVLDERYSQYFGFTQEEVDKLVDSMGYDNTERLKDDLKSWYNGYNFGARTIYNPWSVINYLFDRELQPYWINTSSNNLIIEQIEKNMLNDETFRVSVEELIGGYKIEKRIDDASALRELEYDPDSIWTLFLFSGYLKVENKHYKQQTEEYLYDCSVPNTEVLRFYKKTVINWLQKPARNILYDLANPLITGDGEKFCEKLKRYVMNTLSFYDLKGEPENTYHMILLGMFAHLTGGYWILSNRESGKGRFDVLLKAKNKEDYSAVIEIKPKGTQKAAEDGMKQIEEKEYVQELVSEGYTRILKISLAVDGKDIVARVARNGG
ncbi:MAG: AAA family ATPase [Thermotogota bacterium]